MTEERYTLARCTAHSDHFYLRALKDDEEVGECNSFFNADLARAIDDLKQINFQAELPEDDWREDR